jgi:hypothetical protein
VAGVAQVDFVRSLTALVVLMSYARVPESTLKASGFESLLIKAETDDEKRTLFFRHADAKASAPAFLTFCVRNVAPFDGPAESLMIRVGAAFRLAKVVSFVQLFDLQGSVEDWLGCELGGWAPHDDRPSLHNRLGLTMLHAFAHYYHS